MSAERDAATRRLVRTRVSFVVEIDADRWREDYTDDEVAHDAQEWLTDIVQDYLLDKEVGRIVERPR